MDAVTIELLIHITLDATFPVEVRERAARIKSAIAKMVDYDVFKDPHLVNDVLDVLETLVFIRRRARIVEPPAIE